MNRITWVLACKIGFRNWSRQARFARIAKLSLSNQRLRRLVFYLYFCAKFALNIGNKQPTQSAIANPVGRRPCGLQWLQLSIRIVLIAKSDLKLKNWNPISGVADRFSTTNFDGVNRIGLLRLAESHRFEKIRTLNYFRKSMIAIPAIQAQLCCLLVTNMTHSVLFVSSPFFLSLLHYSSTNCGFQIEAGTFWPSKGENEVKEWS